MQYSVIRSVIMYRFYCSAVQCSAVAGGVLSPGCGFHYRIESNFREKGEEGKRRGKREGSQDICKANINI